MNTMRVCTVVVVVTLMTGAARAQFPGAVAPIGPVGLTFEIATNDDGNWSWLVSLVNINENSIAVELGFWINEGTFLDIPSPIGGTVDDSINASQLQGLVGYNAPGDSHYISVENNGVGGFDTENPGNNVFTGDVTTGWWQGAGGAQQVENPTQIFMALGTGGGQGSRIPIVQLITEPNVNAAILVQGLVSQNWPGIGDKFLISDDYPEGLCIGRLGAICIPEPSTCGIACLAIFCGLVGSRRREKWQFADRCREDE